MMYAFYRNLYKLCLTLGLSVGLLFSLPILAYTAPAAGTSLDGGQKHSFGPDVEGRTRPGIVGGGMVDAYGNPVVPGEEEDVQRQRLRKGAYGGSKNTQSSRPLPDLPETDAGWKFK